MRTAREAGFDIECCVEADCGFNETSDRIIQKAITAARLDVVARLREMAEEADAAGSEARDDGWSHSARAHHRRADALRSAAVQLEQEIREAGK